MTFTDALSAVFNVNSIGLFVTGMMTGVAGATFYWMRREWKLKMAHLRSIQDLTKDFVEIHNDFHRST